MRNKKIIENAIKVRRTSIENLNKELEILETELKNAEVRIVDITAGDLFKFSSSSVPAVIIENWDGNFFLGGSNGNTCRLFSTPLKNKKDMIAWLNDHGYRYDGNVAGTI